jgi:hypothetical protein
MPKRDLTPTQARVLTVLAAGGRIVEEWGGRSWRCYPTDMRERSFAVRWETRVALEQTNPPAIGRLNNTWPYEWRITPAGRDRAAPPAGATGTPAQEG